jgi:hypothetical protein
MFRDAISVYGVYRVLTRETIFAASVKLPAPNVMIRSALHALQSRVTSSTSDQYVWDFMPTLNPATASPNASSSRRKALVFLDSDRDAMIYTLHALKVFATW